MAVSSASAKRVKGNRTGQGLGLGVGKLFHAAKRTTTTKAAAAKGRRTAKGKRQRATRTVR